MHLNMETHFLKIDIVAHVMDRNHTPSQNIMHVAERDKIS